MGVFDFIRDAGSKILKGSKDEKFEAAREAAEQAKEKATEAADRAKSSSAAGKARSAAAAAQKMAVDAAEQAKEKAAEAKKMAAERRAEFEERRAEGRKADELEEHVKALGLSDDIDVRFDDGVAYVSGRVADQATLERVVLAVGNVEGVERVDEELDVESSEPVDAARMYTVQPGDTLSKIAEDHYGDATRFPEIFEANRPMLTDPDLIYPGQTLRIP